MRAFTLIANRSFQQMISYRFEAWIGLLISLSLTATFIALWYAVTDGDPDSLPAVLAYVMATRVLGEVQHMEIMARLQGAIRTGSVAMELLKPFPYPMRLVAESAGRAVWSLLRTIPVYMVMGWLLHVRLPGVQTLLLFLVSGILGWIIMALLELGAASIAFYALDVEGVHHLLDFCQAVFAGAMIPFWFMPEWFVAVARLLPFQGTLYIPGAIFAGRVAGFDLWYGLATQAAWILILAGLVSRVWLFAVRRLVIQGG